MARSVRASLLHARTGTGVGTVTAAVVSRALRCSPTTLNTGTMKLTHVDDAGCASMVDVGEKIASRRTATAEAVVEVGNHVHKLLRENVSPGGKGNVLQTAQLAGIMGAKRTADLIPLCHQVPLAHVVVDVRLDDATSSVRISTRATTAAAQTGVEMEALTAASVSALTVYDMCKAASKDITISGVRLLSKSGGKSGDYRRSDE